MNLHPFHFNALLGLALLATAVAVAPVGARPGGAQQEPTISLQPSSGPCDATIQITGVNFPPTTAIVLDVGRPGTDSSLGELASVVTDTAGGFTLTVRLGELGCEAASMAKEHRLLREDVLFISADLREREITPGEGMPPTLTRALYRFTTTQVGAGAQEEPTISLEPTSGPCDATIEVRGSGFPLSRGPNKTLTLYLVRPGTPDVSFGSLNPGFLGPDGSFAAWAPMYDVGCEAAALDGQAERPSGRLLIAASFPLEPRAVGPGERIPDVIAVAPYTYTTTERRVRTETLDAVLPASGPCDATVEVRGSGFEPGSEVLLQLGRPGSDGMMGTLAAVRVDSDGSFSAQVALGELGCETAQLAELLLSGPDLWVVAASRVRPPGATGRPPVFGSVSYRYTTTLPSRGVPPAALPSTGEGIDGTSIVQHPHRLGIALAVAGALFVAVSLFGAKRTAGLRRQ